ncbi:uncharacterized protein LOC131094976 isoform X1 [Melospiza georgiana]|uniref:uncharacterized protein LOC131094976 isoform X1 n=1 Tax=Melospiza georgiana TaxID=44398 RepID=UPI0025AC7779|nr:uncharacterized protein LOC131094976 isoform X1 [Melospiza georgiana]
MWGTVACVGPWGDMDIDRTMWDMAEHRHGWEHGKHAWGHELGQRQFRHHSATSTFIWAMAKRCLMQFLPPHPHCHHHGVPAECHHPSGQGGDIVHLVTSVTEASDGVPGPPHSGDLNCPWGQGKRRIPRDVRIIRNMIALLILFCILPQFHGQPPGEQLWPKATIQHTNVLGSYPKGHYPSLATLVLHDSKVYRPNEWRWDQNELIRTLMGTVGESIVVTCRKVEGTLHEKATSIIIVGNFMETGGRNHLDIPSAKLCPTKKWGSSKIKSPLALRCHQEHIGSYALGPKTNNVAITRGCNDESLDCWYSFTLVKPTYVTCCWQNDTASPFGLRGLIYTFKINTVPKPTPSAVITLSQMQGVKPFSNTSQRADTARPALSTVNTTITPQLAEATKSPFTWPWSQAFLQFTGSMGYVTGLNLLKVVTHEDKLYTT